MLLEYVAKIAAVLVVESSLLAAVPHGFEVIQVTNDFEFWDTFVDINDCGQVVFSKRMGTSVSQSEIFRYENGKTTQITNNSDRDVGPVINNPGTIIWLRGIGSAGAHQVIRYQVGEEELFVNNPLGIGGLAINDLGHIVWEERMNIGCQGTDRRLRFDDGLTVTTIVEGNGSHQSPSINNLGQIVWTSYDFCLDPWDSEIMMYSDGAIVQVSAGQFEIQNPHINKLTQVVWSGPGGIQFWHPPGVIPEESDDGYYGTFTELTTDGSNTSLNNRGDITYSLIHQDYGKAQIWLYRKGHFQQITDEPFENQKASVINDWGEIVWYFGDFPQSDVMFMRRIRNGEADFNGFVDRNDHAALVSCLTGPTETDGLCDCRFLDIDHDRDVDLADFALFQQNFGWQAPPDLKHPPGTGQQP